LVFAGSVSRIDGKGFIFNAWVISINGDGPAAGEEDDHGHHPVAYAIDSDGVARFYIISNIRANEAIQAGKVAGIRRADTLGLARFTAPARFTASSAALAAFLRTADWDTLFDEEPVAVFTRTFR
jgi:hypothetical protein